MIDQIGNNRTLNEQYLNLKDQLLNSNEQHLSIKGQ